MLSTLFAGQKNPIPLRPLPIDGQCIIFSNGARWNKPRSPKP